MSFNFSPKYVIEQKYYGKVDPPSEKKLKSVDSNTYLSLNSSTRYRKCEISSNNPKVTINSELSHDDIYERNELIIQNASTNIKFYFEQLLIGIKEKNFNQIPTILPFPLYEEKNEQEEIEFLDTKKNSIITRSPNDNGSENRSIKSRQSTLGSPKPVYYFNSLDSNPTPLIE